LFRLWWVPKSFGVTLLSLDADIRTGGTYRLVFGHGDTEMAVFGTYLEVTPHSRIVWTNDEGEDRVVTTVTFEEQGDKTLLVMHDLYPSKEALDAAMASGEKSCTGETFDQLGEVLCTRAA
ncbi:MAG: SRPBCC domain-containing protein, partial [Polyangiales bacterium]